MMDKVRDFKERIPEIKKFLKAGMNIEEISKVLNMEPQGLHFQIRRNADEFSDLRFIKKKRKKK